MKQILLLFLITFLPAQAFAVMFCADGSMPTRAISMDGSYYEYKCMGKQNKANMATNYGPKRLFDQGTSWSFNLTGTLRGTNGMVCGGFNRMVGTCNNGINYSFCSLNVDADFCGTDGTNYTIIIGESIRSSFGSNCPFNSTNTEVIYTCR